MLNYVNVFVILGMIINVKETTVFSVFHPDAHDLFNACSNLKQVVWTLWDPERRLNDDVIVFAIIDSSGSLDSRKNQCGFSGHLRPCSASDLLAELRIQYKRCGARPSLWRKNLTENACNYINEEMSIFIVHGANYLCRRTKTLGHHWQLRHIAKVKITPTCMANMLGKEAWLLTSMLPSIQE